MHSDDYIFFITGPNSIKLARMMHLKILIHLAGLNADSEPKVSDAELG